MRSTAVKMIRASTLPWEYRLVSSCTSSSVSMFPICIQPAGYLVVFHRIREVRHLPTAYVHDLRATRVEGAAVRQFRQRRRAAGHAAAQMLVAELGQRIDQELGIGVHRLAENPLR